MIRLVLIVLASLLLMAASVFAQGSPIDKGTFQLGGSIGFASTSGDLYENADGDGQTAILVNPRVGYFVIPNLSAGAEIGFTSVSQGDATFSEISIGPAVAYYFDLDKANTEPKGKIYPYLGISFTYNQITTNSGGSGAQDNKWTSTTFSVGGGAAYMISGAVGVFAEVGYDMDSSKKTDPVEGDSESGAVIGIMLGITSFIY